MLVHNERSFAQDPIGDFCHNQSETSFHGRASEILQANMIIGFEQAIEQGRQRGGGQGGHAGLRYGVRGVLAPGRKMRLIRQVSYSHCPRPR